VKTAPAAKPEKMATPVPDETAAGQSQQT
jgi:hypothetical protein